MPYSMRMLYNSRSLLGTTPCNDAG